MIQTNGLLTKATQSKMEKIVANQFNVKKFEFENVTSTFYIEKSLFLTDYEVYKIHSETILGYAMLGRAPSKTDYFDYLLLFDTQWTLQNVKVVAYREDYGGEIASSRWLQQFVGKQPLKDIELEGEIAAISGATISVKSMTKSVNWVLKHLNTTYE